jgi:hypothetical protein
MYVPLRLYMYPMGLVYPLGAHLCPLGVKYTPPPSVHAPPPGVRAPFRRSCLPLTVRPLVAVRALTCPVCTP